MLNDQKGQGTRKEVAADNKTGAVAPASISLPKGGGAIRGMGEKFAANLVTGTGSMSVPIATSPGRSGFGPELSLSYDSGAGNGPFGLGWNLSLPSITRKTDKGLPKYQDAGESDVFILSGAEDLVPVGAAANDPSNNYSVRRYRPRIEGLFARIEHWVERASNTSHWRSISKDNITTLYGRAAESRIADPADPTHIFSWLMCESYDDKGNALCYQYKPENAEGIDLPFPAVYERKRSRLAQRYLKRIKYGNTMPRQPNEDLALRTDWMFEVVFDYGEHYAENGLTADDQSQPNVVQIKGDQREWAVRQDPFSSYRSGFEVRTHRLCQRVLMFHHFDELGIADYLVRATHIKYHPDPNVSFITAVTQSGYVLQGSTYLKKSLPPVEFEYSQAKIDETVREVDENTLENIPYGLDGTRYQWVDLDGEGLSGILTEQGGAWFYKRNLGAVLIGEPQAGPHYAARFAPLQRLPTMPSPANLAGGQQLIDLAGDGQLDVVAFDSPTPGFFERTPDEGWATFVPFTSLPNIAWNDPNLKFVDLTGDGHADILITEDEVLTWYPSLAEQGFGPAEKKRQILDEDAGPRLVFADGTQSVYLSDLSGDGLTDLVRIRNGDVCYWPNLGYGHFGAKVTMANAPWFDAPDQFDQKRIRLADIDGSGTTDMLYLGRDGVYLYFNCSGNSWSAVRKLASFPRVDTLSSVMTADLLGNGTACLVWSSPLTGDARQPMRYIDLMGGQKPHLLIKTSNNLGAQTEVHYAPSTQFYLADKLVGRPWITKLPFPVHCVEKVTVTDAWRKISFATTYSYHHGYFDGAEREFRGFGRVEQIDVEDYDTFAEGNINSPYITSDQTLYQPPIQTISWYHTGAALDRERILTQFATEYFPARYPQQGGVLEKALPEPELDANLSSEEWREAFRACKGMLLRQEIYELDLDALQARVSAKVPVRLFSAATHNCHLHRLQPRGQNRHAVFLVTESEALSYHYELDLRVLPYKPDPRITHTLNLRHDDYGNPQQSIAIAYGRAAPGQHADLPRADLVDQVQAERHITYTETRYTDDVVLPKPMAGQSEPIIRHHRLRLPCEVQTYELTGLTPAHNFYFDLAQLRSYHLSDTLPNQGSTLVGILDYHKQPAPNTIEKRLVEHARTLFFDDESDTQAPAASLPFGHHGPRGLKYEDYKLALTEALLGAVFRQPDSQTGIVLDMLDWELDVGIRARDKLDAPITPGSPYLRSGYILGTGIDANLAGQYWMRSGTAGFESEAARHFYLPDRYTDPFGNLTILKYDPRDLFVQSSIDAMGNTSGILVDLPTGKASFDYRVLAPLEMVDPNGNHSEVRYDVLGLVVAAAVKGKKINGTWEGDHLDGFTDAIANPPAADVVAFCTLDTFDEQQARDWLASASVRFVYHFGDKNDLWVQRMAGACAIARQQHAGQLAATRESPLQISLECSDGTSNVLMKKVQAEPDPASTFTPLRWIINGLTVLNNKGKPVKQYEPDFSPNFGGELPHANGVTPVMYYDAAGRLIRTEMPDGTFSRVEFSPWHVKRFDANDTINEPDNAWFARHMAAGASVEDKRAARLSLAHQATPALTILDSLGRDVITIAHNRVEDVTGPREIDGKHYRDEHFFTFTKLDTEGKPLWIRDALGHLVMQYITAAKANHDPSDALSANAVPCYDVAGNLLYQHSMDAGDRWMLTDAAGKPILAWDFNVRNQDNHSAPIAERRLFHTRYDALHRPTEQWLKINLDPLALIEAFDYTDTVDFKSATGVVDQAALATAKTLNLIGQATHHYDPSGLATVERLDFKGAAEKETRTLVANVEVPLVNWNRTDRRTLLEAETFVQITEHDALGRMTRHYNWHVESLTNPGTSERVAVYLPHYNRRGVLENEVLLIHARKIPGGHDEVVGVTRSQAAITRITYNAKGQKLSLELGNGTTTRYSYDADTSRLVHLYTRRDGTFMSDCASDPDAERPARPCGVQNLHYTYDPVGNITHIQDDAQPTIWFDNQQIEPSNDYTYDALYRLIEATGRENNAAVGAPPHPEGNWPTGAFPSAANTRIYTQRYTYDAVGNIKRMRHEAGTGSWTRDYAYAFDDPVHQPASNRLWQTWESGDRTQAVTYRYDTHGSMLNLANTALGQDICWDWRDMIRALDQQGGGDAFYNYGSDKQRTRKRLERNGSSKDRIYLGGYELYRRKVAGVVVEEIESLHLFEGEQRVLLVDDVLKTDRTYADGRPFKTEPILRYQYGNHLSSVGLELDEAAQVISYEEYHPYGTSAYRLLSSAVEAPAKRYRYTGMERDEESGLGYHTARYYAPWLGRWVSCDPRGVGSGVNTYFYCSANPCRMIDPRGTVEGPGVLDAGYKEQTPPINGDVGQTWKNDAIAGTVPAAKSLTFSTIDLSDVLRSDAKLAADSRRQSMEIDFGLERLDKVLGKKPTYESHVYTAETISSARPITFMDDSFMRKMDQTGQLKTIGIALGSYRMIGGLVALSSGEVTLGQMFFSSRALINGGMASGFNLAFQVWRNRKDVGNIDAYNLRSIVLDYFMGNLGSSFASRITKMHPVFSKAADGTRSTDWSNFGRQQQTLLPYFVAQSQARAFLTGTDPKQNASAGLATTTTAAGQSLLLQALSSTNIGYRLLGAPGDTRYEGVNKLVSVFRGVLISSIFDTTSQEERAK